MKRSLILLVVTALVITSLFMAVGCKAPAPAPAPTVTVTTTAPAPAPAPTTTAKPAAVKVRVASATIDTFGYSLAQKKWGDLVTERTGGKYQFEYFWGGSLVKSTELIDAVEKRVVEMVMMSPNYLPARLPLGNITFSVPFSPTSIVMLEKIAWKLFEQPDFQREGRQFNFMNIMPLFIERYDILTTVPVKTLADFKGVKIAGIATNLPIIAATGATPVAMPVGERYTSLQTGVVQGSLLGVCSMDRSKFQEVAKHLTLTNMGGTMVGMHSANLDFWNSVPEADKKIMMDTAKDAAKWHAEDRDADVTATLAKWQKDAGVSIYQLSDADLKAWAEKVKDLPLKWAKDLDAKGIAGSKFLEVYVKEAEAQGWKFPYSVLTP